MSHHIYNTRGFVLGSRPLREADRLFSILTPDLGLVFATATGIRKGNAKLSGSLPDLSLVHVSLVRGKHVWRITTASLGTNFPRELRDKKTALVSLARVCALIERLVRGEEKHAELFEALVEDVNILYAQTNVQAWEIFTVLHVLYHLGYFSKGDLPESVEAIVRDKKQLVQRINDALRESGLA